MGGTDTLVVKDFDDWQGHLSNSSPRQGFLQSNLGTQYAKDGRMNGADKEWSTSRVFQGVLKEWWRRNGRQVGRPSASDPLDSLNGRRRPRLSSATVLTIPYILDCNSTLYRSRSIHSGILCRTFCFRLDEQAWPGTYLILNRVWVSVVAGWKEALPNSTVVIGPDFFFLSCIYSNWIPNGNIS